MFAMAVFVKLLLMRVKKLIKDTYTIRMDRNSSKRSGMKLRRSMMTTLETILRSLSQNMVTKLTSCYKKAMFRSHILTKMSKEKAKMVSVRQTRKN